MPQVFQVLRCYKCLIFQIHHTKKSNKFECKMCGEKQSIKRHYGIGTGKDCRLHVQKLNILRGNMEVKFTTESNEEYNVRKNNEDVNNSVAISDKHTKWSAFIDKKEETETSEEPMFLGGKEVFLDITQKRKISKFKIKAKHRDSTNFLCNENNNPKIDMHSNSRLFNKNNKDNIQLEKNVLIGQDNDILMNTFQVSACDRHVTYSNINNTVVKTDLEKPAVLQTIDENSKWAQYVDKEESNENIQDVIISNRKGLFNSDNIFSLSDESDLDNVLDI